LCVEVYMKPPPWYFVPDGMVCRLHLSLSMAGPPHLV
jgi:hypothetical protein